MRGHRTKRTRGGRYRILSCFTSERRARVLASLSRRRSGPLYPPPPSTARDFTSFHEFVRRKLARSFALPSRLSGEDFLRTFSPRALSARVAASSGAPRPAARGYRGLPTRGVRRRERARCGRARCKRSILDRRPGRMSSSRRVVDRGGCSRLSIAISDEVRLRFVRRHAKSTRELERVNADAVRRPALAREGLDGTGSTTSTAKSLEHPNDRDRARPVALGERDSSRSSSRRGADPPRVRLAGRTERELPPHEDHHPHARAESRARRSSSADRRGSSVDRRRRTRRAPPNCRT